MKKNLAKELYVDRITKQTTYPVFRSLIGILTILIHLLAVVSLAIGGALSFSLVDHSFFFATLVLIATLIISFILYIIGRLVYEVASILADLADSTLDLNSRYEQQETEAHVSTVS